jgi:hypothetical protein
MNKISRTAKENIEKVFEARGGWEGYLAWTKKSLRNETIFYSEIYPKLLPLDVKHSGSVDSNISVIFNMPRPGQAMPGKK